MMANSAPRTTFVPRPASAAPRPAPQLVCLPTADLEELPVAKPPSVPPPLPERRRSETVPVTPRRGGPPIFAMLGDKLSSLDAQPDSLAAARACVDALAAVVPCRAVLVHAFDAARRDFLVVHARGEGAAHMVLTRHPSTDPLLRVTMPSGQPFAWDDLRRAPVRSLARFSELDGVRTILHAPVAAAARWLAAFELVDPAGGAAFGSQDALGARYVANRYRQYLATHELVIDIGRVARFASR